MDSYRQATSSARYTERGWSVCVQCVCQGLRLLRFAVHFMPSPGQIRSVIHRLSCFSFCLSAPSHSLVSFLVISRSLSLSILHVLNSCSSISLLYRSLSCTSTQARDKAQAQRDERAAAEADETKRKFEEEIAARKQREAGCVIKREWMGR